VPPGLWRTSDDQSFHPGESFEYAIEGGIGLFFGKAIELGHAQVAQFVRSGMTK
jgi:hypothetical protein